MDARTWSLALNTLLLCGATCAISLPLGSVLAWLLARTDLPGRRIGMGLLGLMLFVPLYLQAAAWQAGFGVQGWYTLGYNPPAWLVLKGWTGAIWVHSMAAVPWVALIVGLGLRLIEPELEEQALLDGSPTQVFLRVTLRSALPAVGVAAVWVTIVTAGEMTVTDLFMVRTYAEELFTRLAIQLPPEEAVLGMWPGMAITAGLVVAVMALCAKLLPRQRPSTVGRRWVFRLGRWRAPAAILAASALLLVVGVPLVNLCCKAGVVVTQTESGWLRSWSLGKCLAMAATSPVRYWREFGWSLAIGTLAATGAVIAAIALASPALSIGGASCTSRRWAGGLRALPALLATAVCLALPGPVVGLGLIWLLYRPECPPLLWLYDQPIPAPWMALVVRALPLATLVIWHALRTVPVELLEAAAVDGAGPLRRLAVVALPCRLSAVALAWVVALAIALGDLAASFLVVPPGVETLSRRVFGLLHSGEEVEVAGICLGLIVLFAAVAATAAWLVSRWGRQSVTE